MTGPGRSDKRRAAATRLPEIRISSFDPLEPRVGTLCSRACAPTRGSKSSSRNTAFNQIFEAGMLTTGMSSRVVPAGEVLGLSEVAHVGVHPTRRDPAGHGDRRSAEGLRGHRFLCDRVWGVERIFADCHRKSLTENARAKQAGPLWPSATGGGRSCS